MAKVAFSAPAVGSALLPKASSCSLIPPRSRCSLASVTARKPTGIHAALGGGDGELKRGEKKKFITREEEPDQYWQTAGEREGENPMKTPLPYIIIFGMSTPFVILAIAFANGWIKVPV
ncbi:hypothetical protein ACMD2_19228, partial [Ananas comosus]